MMAKTLGRLTLISFACVGLLALGCKKEEPPPPLPTAAPVTTSTAPLILKPEDAGVKLPPPDAGAKKKTGGGGGGSSLKACCAALQQNSHSQPTEQLKQQMQMAAGICNAAVAAGQGSGALGAIQAALRGAQMPSGCR